jgi:SagB-type dehydrogenase family enzyme
MRFFEQFHARSQKMPPFGPKEQWPEAWTTAERKRYPALPATGLLEVGERGAVASVIAERSSSRRFSGRPLTAKALSRLLTFSLGELPRAEGSDGHAFRRPFPSAGALYPLEIYVLILAAEAPAPGLYHFDPKLRTLTYLKNKDFLIERMQEAVGYEWAANASAIVFLTSVFERTVRKYGERGYRLALLEAGHAGQNLCIIGHEEGIKSCPLALRDESIVNQFLGVDGVTESVVHTIALGV